MSRYATINTPPSSQGLFPAAPGFESLVTEPATPTPVPVAETAPPHNAAHSEADHEGSHSWLDNVLMAAGNEVVWGPWVETAVAFSLAQPEIAAPCLAIALTGIAGTAALWEGIPFSEALASSTKEVGQMIISRVTNPALAPVADAAKDGNILRAAANLPAAIMDFSTFGVTQLFRNGFRALVTDTENAATSLAERAAVSWGAVEHAFSGESLAALELSGKNVLSASLNTLSSAGNLLSGALVALPEKGQELAEEFVVAIGTESLRAAATNAVETVTTTATAAMDKASTAVSSAWDAASTPLTTAWNDPSGTATAVAEGAKATGQAIGTQIADITTSTSTFVASRWNALFGSDQAPPQVAQKQETQPAIPVQVVRNRSPLSPTLDASITPSVAAPQTPVATLQRPALSPTAV